MRWQSALQLALQFLFGAIFGMGIERRRRRRCPHINVRCTHGDEIIHRGYKRRVCLDCGRALDGPLPEPCSVTGEPHLSAREGDDG